MNKIIIFYDFLHCSLTVYNIIFSPLRDERVARGSRGEEREQSILALSTARWRFDRARASPCVVVSLAHPYNTLPPITKNRCWCAGCCWCVIWWCVVSLSLSLLIAPPRKINEWKKNTYIYTIHLSRGLGESCDTKALLGELHARSTKSPSWVAPLQVP